LTAPSAQVGRFRALVNPIIAQIDSAYRRVAALKRRPEPLAPRTGRAAAGLSAREEEIMRLVAQGRTNREISASLAISGFTVKNHVHRIMKKLGVANRTEAAAKFRGAGKPLAGGSSRSSPVSPAD
jgi:DNA-binding CsgD family transcriptional regulator